MHATRRSSLTGVACKRLVAIEQQGQGRVPARHPGANEAVGASDVARGVTFELNCPTV
jgi:hypothetical protein